MQDPPLDYGAYGVTVVAGGQLHQAYNGFACYLDLEPYHGPLEGTFAALKPISEYIKGILTEDLLLNSVLALLHQPRRERTPVHLSHHCCEEVANGIVSCEKACSVIRFS